MVHKNIYYLAAAVMILIPLKLSGQLSTELNEAYYRNSYQQADHFFRKWGKLSKPADTDKLNDTLRFAYELFEDYYILLEQKKSGSNPLNPHHPKSKYLLVEPHLNIYMKDTVYYSQEYISELKRKYEDQLILSANLSSMPVPEKPQYAPHFGYETYGYMNARLVDSVTEFRPSVTIKGHQLLYLTPDYLRALNLFLGAEGNNLANGNFKQTLLENDINKRLVFLNRYISVSQGRIINFHINSYPAPYAITFEPDFQHARIDYVMGEQIGFAVFQRKDRDWIFILSSITGSL